MMLFTEMRQKIFREAVDARVLLAKQTVSKSVMFIGHPSRVFTKATEELGLKPREEVRGGNTDLGVRSLCTGL